MFKCSRQKNIQMIKNSIRTSFFLLILSSCHPMSPSNNDDDFWKNPTPNNLQLTISSQQNSYLRGLIDETMNALSSVKVKDLDWPFSLASVLPKSTAVKTDFYDKIYPHCRFQNHTEHSLNTSVLREWSENRNPVKESDHLPLSSYILCPIDLQKTTNGSDSQNIDTREYFSTQNVQIDLNISELRVSTVYNTPPVITSLSPINQISIKSSELLIKKDLRGIHNPGKEVQKSDWYIQISYLENKVKKSATMGAHLRKQLSYLVHSSTDSFPLGREMLVIWIRTEDGTGLYVERNKVYKDQINSEEKININGKLVK